MYVMEVTYACKSCYGKSVITTHEPNGVAVKKVGHIAEADRPDSCRSCYGKMKINRIKLQKPTTSASIYGSSRAGFWQCPDHKYISVNPLALEYAHTDVEQLKKHWPDYKVNICLKITKNAFPWKCPLCHRSLLFFTK